MYTEPDKNKLKEAMIFPTGPSFPIPKIDIKAKAIAYNSTAHSLF